MSEEQEQQPVAKSIQCEGLHLHWAGFDRLVPAGS